MNDYQIINLKDEVRGRELRFALDEINEINNDIRLKLNKLERILVQKRRSFFVYDCLEGFIDHSRLPQIIVNPAKKDYYKQVKEGDVPETNLTFLIDSDCFENEEMHKALVSVLDECVKSLEKSEIHTEILGFDETKLITYKKSIESWHQAKNRIPFLLLEHPRNIQNVEDIAKKIIQRQKKSIGNKKIVIFFSNKAFGKTLPLFAARNSVCYEYIDTKLHIESSSLRSKILNVLGKVFKIKI